MTLLSLLFLLDMGLYHIHTIWRRGLEQFIQIKTSSSRYYSPTSLLLLLWITKVKPLLSNNKKWFDNIIYSDWKQSIRRKKEIRKRLTKSRNFWIRSSLNFFSNQIKTFLHLFSLSVLSSQTRVPFFLPRPWLSLSRTLYFHFRLILFGYQSSTPPVVSGHGPFAWDMSATSPAFLGPRAEAGQKSSIELKRG